ncbi:hypothetical protein Bhyg_06575 [Pseudolycoriella hygida]|uniref:Uncharacterized protein n=1 Tax=Pseudolycoriella hygida TaxID=35572 RepID=A0A9Q0S2Z1_9DIPT|nr:hypothetical protein Bhyg_06575 [Pseudolycoriella hygida]
MNSSVNSSDIKLSATNRNISKIYVYATDTFYVDEDLKLSGIKELQIFAKIWNVIPPSVTFDLSGSNGANQEPASEGSGGRPVNGGRLTIKTNGGTGAAGQDGGGSDDIYVLLNAEEDLSDSGSNISTKKDTIRRLLIMKIKPLRMQLFWQDKKTNFVIRLHSKKCCGTIGAAGVGGPGGRSGQVDFVTLTDSKRDSETKPKRVTNDGLVGLSGKNGECKNLALDVRIDAELKETSLVSSRFTALNHAENGKCSPVYERNFESIPTQSVLIHPSRFDFSVLRYKQFLLESMRNESLTVGAQKMYLAIDENSEITSDFSLTATAKDACELEKNFIELKEKIDLTPFYKRFSHRLKTIEPYFYGTDREGLYKLQEILEHKLFDFDSDRGLIVDVGGFAELIVPKIEQSGNRFALITVMGDFELKNALNNLTLRAHENYVLNEYSRAIKGFQLNYFPYAANYLENYRLPTSHSSYNDINALVKATTKKLNTLAENIEQISLLADVKKSTDRFNLFKFNTIELVFRSSDPSVNSQLNQTMRHFKIVASYGGPSDFRCNNHFYTLKCDSTFIYFSYEKSRRDQDPVMKNGVYLKLKENDAVLSPYTLWEFSLHAGSKSTKHFRELAQFSHENIDIELHGTGTYLDENSPICENNNLANIKYTYSPMKLHVIVFIVSSSFSAIVSITQIEMKLCILKINPKGVAQKCRIHVMDSNVVNISNNSKERRQESSLHYKCTVKTIVPIIFLRHCDNTFACVIVKVGAQLQLHCFRMQPKTVVDINKDDNTELRVSFSHATQSDSKDVVD